MAAICRFGPLAVFAVLVLALTAVPAAAEDAWGSIQSIDANRTFLTLDDGSSLRTRYEVTPQTRIRVAGKDGTLNDLKVGDLVTVVYDRREPRNIALLIERK